MKILVIDRRNQEPEVVKRLAMEHFVLQEVDENETVEVICIISMFDDQVQEIETLLTDHTNCVRLAYGPLKENPDVWNEIESSIDDLFYDALELENRLPFLHRRLKMRESKRRQFAAVFESTVEGIIIINTHGTIQLFNKAAENIFLYSHAEVVGKNVKTLMPEMYSRNHDQYLVNYLTTGRKKIIGIGREVSGLRKNKEVFPMDLAVSEFESDGNRLFVGIVRDVSERRRLEHEILRISEQERRRVGQDLHDGLGQMLTGITLIGRSLAKRMEESGSEMAEDMYEITDLVRDADRMARDIARGLVQVEHEGDGMSAALRTLASNAERYFSVKCTYQEFGNVSINDSSAASNLFRIAQEAVSNAAKHGHAENVIITLQGTPHALILSIEDDGVGFPEELKADRGMGVDIMGYRARVINATLEIEAENGRGTIVRCTLSSPYTLN